MKKTYVVAAAVIGLALAVPVSAHHNAPQDVEDNMPREALETHNLAIDVVVGRLEDIGVAGNMEGSTSSNDLDPADAAQGDTCSTLFDTICTPGNEENPSEGMDRGPSTTTLPAP